MVIGGIACVAFGARRGVRARLSTALATLAVAVLPACGEEEGVSTNRGHVDPGDTLVGQGVEIIDGRFVPDLVAARAAQPINFTNRDDVPHRIVKVSGPGRHFRSGVIEPGERYKLRLLGKPGWKLRQGTLVYRSTSPGEPTGRIAVTGTLIPRRDDPPHYPRPAWSLAPERPDWAAERRAHDLAAWVSQCQDPRRCDTGAELVRNVSSGHGVQFVPGSSQTVLRSAVGSHGPTVRLGGGPDETEIDATRRTFTITSHSRTGRDFVLRGTGRDPDSWSTRWARTR